MATVGYATLTALQADSGIGHLVSGVAVVSAVVTEVILSAAPPERVGAASALAETSAEFGGALGIALLGSIGTAVYRSELAATAPDDLTPEALEAAKGTLGGAVETAAALPPGTANSLRSAAFDAFAREARIASVISAVLMAGAAILIATLLRTARTRTEPRTSPSA